jgi:hypothetical protein
MTREMTSKEVRTAGLKALLEALGPAGMLRFLQETSPGKGDYTAERHQWLDELTVEEIVADIVRRRGDPSQNER